MALVDALRLPVTRELKKPVIFNVGSLKVKDGWAVLSVTPLQPNGSKFDYKGTKYEHCMSSEGDCGSGVIATLRKQNGSWTVVEYFHRFI